MLEDVRGIVEEKVEWWTAEQSEEREDEAKNVLRLCDA
jgi:hypothetical protein